ncbi:MAG: hypothetical protein WCF76_02295 [Pseudolabrys sp.]
MHRGIDPYAARHPKQFCGRKTYQHLHSGFPERTPIHVLIEALRALGHENGTTAVIEVLGGEGDAGRLGTLVNGIAASKPDVTIALTLPVRGRTGAHFQYRQSDVWAA